MRGLWIAPLFASVVLAQYAPGHYGMAFAEAGEDRVHGLGTANVYRGPDLYERGQDALRHSRWETAVQTFGSIPRNNSRADAALYWKAYALNKLGRRPEALAATADLRKSFPSSRWLNDAAALELEIKQAGGQPVSPESQHDEELKLLAINSLMQSDPSRAIPLLEKILTGNNSPAVKERALFVVAQSGTEESRNILAGIAKGKGNPDLQMRAIELLGIFGGKVALQTLADIYGSVGDPGAKKRVLRAFMIAGDRGRLLSVARQEKDPGLQTEAIRQLGVLGARNELADLYASAASVDAKKEIIRALFVGGATERLGQLARSERETELRLAAIHSLGLMGAKTAPDLLAIYSSDSNKDVRKAVLKALFLQQNAKALVEIARKESDPELKHEAVRNLSLVNSKESTEFMMEILNK